MGGTLSTRLAAKLAAFKERRTRTKAQAAKRAKRRKAERDRLWREAHPNYYAEWFFKKHGRVQAKLRRKSKSEREVASLLKIVRESQKFW